MINFGIAEVYYGNSGKVGYYNSQQIGLSRAMKKLGYNCYIFLPDISIRSATEETIEENITMIRCPAKTIGVHAKFDWNIIKNYNIEVLQVGSDNHLFAGSLMRFCERNNILAYSYFGTVKSDSSNKIKRVIIDSLFKKNISIYRRNMNFAKTMAVKKDLAELGIKNSIVVPVGLDTTVVPDLQDDRVSVRKKLGLPVDRKILLYVGRMDDYKRPQLFLSVLDELKDSYGVMIGDGALTPELEKMIDTMGIKDRIKWYKKLPNDQVHNFYYVADYFLNFNDHEIFGMSILEAMYQGCTVVAYHAPGPDTIIESGVTGYLVAEQEEMLNVIRNDLKLDRQTIKKRVLDSFSWDSTAASFNEWITANFTKPLPT